MDRKINLIYILLPFILWPIAFIILRDIFLISMAISTGLIGILSITLYRDRISLGGLRGLLIIGPPGSIILYFIFYIGDILADILYLSGYIDEVYVMVGSAGDKSILLAGLVWIGFMEELYWRGGLQGLFRDVYGARYPWIYSSILYSTVHISTLNPILIISSLIIGLFLGLISEYHGVAATIFIHVSWLILILLIYPLR